VERLLQGQHIIVERQQLGGVRMLVPQAPDSMPAARPDRVWWHSLTERPFRS
jgi:hypothetical protein